jgi:hypothetical protein
MPTFRLILGSFFGSLAFISTSHAIPKNIPTSPDLSLTPGDVCERNEANEFRYPERIPYCRRDVDVETKEDVFDRYDRKYGLSRNGYTRHSFKIDHFVSLCMGGSNDASNLWPQHITVSEITDKIEELLCIEMKNGKMKQAEAIETMRKVKMDLKLAPAIQKKLEEETRR